MGEPDRSPTSSGALTLLFTDIEHSSASWDRDPAAMRVALHLHDQLLREVVDRRCGRVFFSGGDGFGIAFESAADAVGAAIEGQQALAAAAWPDSTRLAVRMGLHTGVVEQRDGNVFGSTVNRAARVADAGHGGQVLLSGVTAALVDPGLELVDQGTFALRGLREPERLWWLPVPDGAPGPFPPPRTVRSGRASQPPLPTRLRYDGDVGFVGRGRQVEQMVLAVQETWAGTSPVVLVAGEAGVGKSRLVAEVGLRLHAGGTSVLYGRCDPDAGAPYQPFAQALSSLAEGLDAPTARAVLAPHRAELARLVPRLHQPVPGAGETLDGDPGGDRYRVFHAVSDALAALAETSTGVMLVLDDLHWADGSTLALLEHLTVAAAPPGLAVVVVYRSTDVGRDAPVERVLGALRRRGGATVVELDGLTVGEVGTYLAAVDAELAVLQDLVTDLHTRTDGNPFFLRELVRHVQGAELAHGGDPTELLARAGTPQGVRELVHERLRALPGATVELLEAAAVAGVEFDVRLVSRTLHTDVPAALTALEPAVAVGLVGEAGGGAFAFVHALVRSSIYDDLPPGRRIAGHVAAARALEATGGADRHWPELAHHWGEAAMAGHAAEAVESSLRAAERSIAAAAHDAAVDHLRRAASNLVEATEGDPVSHIEVQLRLAEALTLAGRLDEAEPVFLASADAARRAGRADLFGRAALGLGGDLPSTPPENRAAVALVEEALLLHPDPSPARALLLCRLAERRHRTDPGAARRALVDEALDVARALGDDGLLARVMLSRVRALHGPGAMAEMLEISTEVDRIATLLPDDALAVRSAQVRMNACFVLGDLAGAVQAARVTSVLAARLRQPEYQRLPLMWDAFRAMYEGRFDAGSAICDELRALLRSGRHSQTAELVGALLTPRFVFQGRSEAAYQISKDFDFSYRDALLASFSAEAGELDRARHHLERLGPIERIGSDDNWSWWQGMASAANAAVICDDRRRMAELRDAIVPWAHQHATAGLVTYLGSGHHHLGVLHVGLGDLDAGIHELRQAIVAHESIGARPFTALSRVELARALDHRGGPGDGAAAAEARSAALDVAGQLGLATVVARA